MEYVKIDEIEHRFDDTVSIEERVVKPPRIIFGSTVINPEFSIIMEYDGLAKIMADMKSGDSLRVTMFAGNRAEEYSIVRKAVPRKKKEGEEHEQM